MLSFHPQFSHHLPFSISLPIFLNASHSNVLVPFKFSTVSDIQTERSFLGSSTQGREILRMPLLLRGYIQFQPFYSLRDLDFSELEIPVTWNGQPIDPRTAGNSWSLTYQIQLSAPSSCERT